jgi:hypothetical protein
MATTRARTCERNRTPGVGAGEVQNQWSMMIMIGQCNAASLS